MANRFINADFEGNAEDWSPLLRAEDESASGPYVRGGLLASFLSPGMKLAHLQVTVDVAGSTVYTTKAGIGLTANEAILLDADDLEIQVGFKPYAAFLHIEQGANSEFYMKFVNMPGSFGWKLDHAGAVSYAGSQMSFAPITGSDGGVVTIDNGITVDTFVHDIVIIGK